MHGGSVAGGEAARAYSSRVLVGNWYEERQVQRDVAQRHATQAAAQQAAQQQQQTRYHAALLQPRAALDYASVAPHDTYKLHTHTHARAADGASLMTTTTTTTSAAAAPLVRFGVALHIVSEHHTHGVLATTTTTTTTHATRPACDDAPVVVRPLTRGADDDDDGDATWLLQRAPDEHGVAYATQLHERDVLHYGQRVLLVRNVRDDARGFRCLRSRLCYIGEQQPHQQQQQMQVVSASLGVCADSVFVVGRVATRRGDVRVEGDVVRYGDAVVLLHAATNKPLHCGDSNSNSNNANSNSSNARAASVVCCGYACDASTRHTHARAAVAMSSRNTFHFVPAAAAAAANTAAAVSSRAHALPCVDSLYTHNNKSNNNNNSNDDDDDSDVVTAVLARIRAGAAALGGRLGLRALSLALGTACDELAHTPLTRAQLHAAVASLGVTLLPLEHDVLRTRFDVDGRGTICAQALMAALRGSMSRVRHDAVMHAYAQLLIEGDGAVTFALLRSLYAVNAHTHADVRDGVATAAQLLREFELSMPGRVVGGAEGVVRVEVFVAYHADVSLAYDDDDDDDGDARFVRWVQSCWRVPARA